MCVGIPSRHRVMDSVTALALTLVRLSPVRQTERVIRTVVQADEASPAESELLGTAADTM
eukprot:1737482-Prymnesium_polylepis.1